jgi:type I restriction enzyme S subunit
MNELPRGWIAAQLYECASFNPRHPADADRSVEVSFVPMPAVSEVSGTIEGGKLGGYQKSGPDIPISRMGT